MNQTLTPAQEKVSQKLGRQHVSRGETTVSIGRADEKEISQYHWLGRSLRYLLDASYTDSAISVVIMFNIMLIVREADAGATCRLDGTECSITWLNVSNMCLLAFYTVEAAIRLYVFRQQIIHRRQDLADMIILMLSFADLIISEVVDGTLPGVQMLRIFRLSKICRAARVLRVFPELYVMLRGFLSAMSAMLWGCILIMLLLVMWSIVAVEFLQPISLRIFDEGSTCHTSFNSVFNVTLLFFQMLVAGDSWGACSIGIIKEAPLTWLLFALSLIMIQIGLTNLILAVVVEKAAEAHEEDVENKLRQINAERKRAEQRLGLLCDQIDHDQDGVIGLKELTAFAQESNELKEVLYTLDIRIEDLTNLFHLMDKDSSGDLTYDELVDCISRADSNDLKRQVMMLKLQMSDVWSRIRGQIQGSMSNMEKDLQVLTQHVDTVLTADRRELAPPTCKQPPDLGGLSTQYSGKLLQMPAGSSIINEEMDCIRHAVDLHLSRLAADLQQRLGNGIRSANTQEATGKSSPVRQDADLFRAQVGSLRHQILALVAAETGAPWYSRV
eukprot:TRINITY_DN33665_c0_g1_i1.p1 TRINITY_DN33665_c0_g1~~TRINITY_DN33665_c0_g1_i1.p1  ORF type:complete len:557 (-),score=92.18 TRINITY_DN33665_c0_g1_i1:108-1778(-)